MPNLYFNFGNFNGDDVIITIDKMLVDNCNVYINYSVYLQATEWLSEQNFLGKERLIENLEDIDTLKKLSRRIEINFKSSALYKKTIDK